MVLTRVKINEFDQFWSVFSTKGADKRREHGKGGLQGPPEPRFIEAAVELPA